ncbi:unnamed protein product [Cunninghamella echinulata]
MTFPPEFDQKIDIKKVNLDVMKPWISNRITQILGLEDDVIVDFTFGLLEEEKPDPRRMQINLTGFLEKDTGQFMLDLWKLLLSAQDSVGGIPQEFIDQKKEELRLKKEQEEKRRAEEQTILDTIRRKKEEEKEQGQDYPKRERRSRFDEPSSRHRHSNRNPSPSRQRRRHRSRSPRRDSYYKEDRYSRRR